MTTRQRLLAAWHCEDVDHTPFALHFWPSPLHPKAAWSDERGRLDFHRQREWDACTRVITRVTPSPEVRVDVSRETADGREVLRQVWHTPAGSVTERLTVTDDWPPPSVGPARPVPFLDDFRTSRYIEFPFKTDADLEALPHLFPIDNPRDVEGLTRDHAAARALADEFDVPLTAYHSAGMDWLIWLYPPAEAIVRAMEGPAAVRRLLDHVNAACRSRLKTLATLGVDAVCRRGWYESADLWSPSIFREFAKAPLAEDVDLCHDAGAVAIYLMDSGVTPLLNDLDDLDFDCLWGVDPATQEVDLTRVRDALPGKSLWGGVSGPLHLGRGTPADAERAVERAFASCGRRGLILGPAVGIRHDWPWENIEAAEGAWRRLCHGFA